MSRMTPVVIALGSNLGDRRRHLRTAVGMLAPDVRVVRLSSVWESDPVDCPPDSRPFLNMTLSGLTSATPSGLMTCLHDVENAVGRRRRLRNDPRPIDLDLIFYGAHLSSRDPAIPHPRFAERNFVLKPLAELLLDWTVGGERVRALSGKGTVRRIGSLY